MIEYLLYFHFTSRLYFNTEHCVIHHIWSLKYSYIIWRWIRCSRRLSLITTEANTIVSTISDVHALIMLFVYIYVSWCTTRLSCQVMCRLTVTRQVSLVERKLIILPEHLSSPLVICCVRVTPSEVFCVVCLRPLYLFPFCEPLYYLFFDWRLLTRYHHIISVWNISTTYDNIRIK